MISSEEAKNIACNTLQKHLTGKIVAIHITGCKFRDMAGTPVFEVRGELTFLLPEKRFLPGRKQAKQDFLVRVNARDKRVLSWIVRG